MLSGQLVNARMMPILYRYLSVPTVNLSLASMTKTDNCHDCDKKQKDGRHRALAALDSSLSQMAAASTE
jgi:hypothetical protein